MDNLDSQTYEIFEKDPIKYVQYEKVCIPLPSNQILIIKYVQHEKVCYM